MSNPKVGYAPCGWRIGQFFILITCSKVSSEFEPELEPEIFSGPLLSTWPTLSHKTKMLQYPHRCRGHFPGNLESLTIDIGGLSRSDLTTPDCGYATSSTNFHLKKCVEPFQKCQLVSRSAGKLIERIMKSKIMFGIWEVAGLPSRRECRAMKHALKPYPIVSTLQVQV